MTASQIADKLRPFYTANEAADKTRSQNAIKWDASVYARRSLDSVKASYIKAHGADIVEAALDILGSEWTSKIPLIPADENTYKYEPRTSLPHCTWTCGSCGETHQGSRCEPCFKALVAERESLIARIKPGKRGVTALRVRLGIVTNKLLELERDYV